MTIADPAIAAINLRYCRRFAIATAIVALVIALLGSAAMLDLRIEIATTDNMGPMAGAGALIVEGMSLIVSFVVLLIWLLLGRSAKWAGWRIAVAVPTLHVLSILILATA